MKTDAEVADAYLPSRMLGAGLSDLKDVEKTNMIAFKGTALPGTGIFDRKMAGAAKIAGYNIPFALNYAGPEDNEKPRKAMLMWGPIADRVQKYWAAEFKASYTGKAAAYKAMSEAEQEMTVEKGMVAALEAAGKDKKNPIDIKGGFKKKRHYNKGQHYPLPAAMGPTEAYQFWDAALAKGTIPFAICLSDKYAKFNTLSGDEYMAAMVLPSGKTHSHAFIRCCTFLAGKIGKTEIRFLDDNLNGTFGEPGVDSVMVGSSASFVGEHLSVEGKVYKIKLEQEMKKDKLEGKLTLEPVSNTGFIKCVFKGPENSELKYAQVCSEKSWYPIANMEEKKSGSSRSSKEPEFIPVAVPAGTYQLAGGLVHRELGKGKEAYAAFTGGNPITVAAGKTTTVTLGQPISASLKFEEDGEDRVVSMGYPTGAAGEQYRWVLPRPFEAVRLTVTGREGSAFLEPVRKPMNPVWKDKVMMEARFKFDIVLFVVENGPFKFESAFNPMVFDRFNSRMERKEMSLTTEERNGPAAKAE